MAERGLLRDGVERVRRMRNIIESNRNDAYIFWRWRNGNGDKVES